MEARSSSRSCARTAVSFSRWVRTRVAEVAPRYLTPRTKSAAVSCSPVSALIARAIAIRALRRGAFAALHHADVVGMQVCGVRKRLLRQA
jgi:hypothetical protein